MKPLSVETIVGKMTAYRVEEEIVLEVEGASDYLDIAQRLSVPLNGFSYPTHYNTAIPETDRRLSLWAFAAWMASLTVARRLAREGGDPELAAGIRNEADILRRRMEITEATIAGLRTAWPKLASGSPERMVARGQLERELEERVVTAWEKRLSEDMEGALDGKDPPYVLPSFASWPEIGVPLSVGGTVKIRPQFTGDLDVIIRKENGVRLDGRIVYGDAFVSRDGENLKREYIDARAFGKWPPEEWIARAKELFDEAVATYRTAHAWFDAEVMKRCALVERVLREEYADDLALFETPHDRGMTYAVHLVHFYGSPSSPAVKEVEPGRFYLRDFRPFIDPKGKRLPVGDLLAIVKRCDDGELALVGWSGTTGNGRECRPDHGSGRPDVGLYVAKEALIAMEGLNDKGGRRKRA